MSNKAIAPAICDALMNQAPKDPNLLVLCSDSRGSAGLVPFADRYPDHLVEVGIAEQDLVTISAGLAHAGKHPFAFSPAAFLTMRSIEQVKVDVAYSNTNVKLIGISGGNAYSVLGSTHHSLQDFAITRAIPNLEVYTPADAMQATGLMHYLFDSPHPAYVRIGKMALPKLYASSETAFHGPGHANILVDNGNDVALITAGEMVNAAVVAAVQLETEGIHAKVIDLVSIKPLDIERLNQVADQVPAILTIEEHSIYGGLGGAVAEALAPRGDTRLKITGFPDAPAIAGTQAEVFSHYGLDATGIVANTHLLLRS